MNPLVSVVMPTYGRPKFLINAIESILAQDYENYELIVVDDNSPESDTRIETEKVLQPFLKQYGSKVHYIKRETNGGGSLARNDGIFFSKGEYVTFLDDDDEYLKNKISMQVKHILDNQLDVSLCGMQAVRNKKFVNYRGEFARGGNLKEFILDGCTFTPMIMVSRDLLIKVNGFTVTSRFQDHLLMLKLLNENPKVKILYEKLYFFNMHDENRITFSKKSFEALILKHKEEVKYCKNFSEAELIMLKKRQNKEKIIVMAKYNLDYKPILIESIKDSKNIFEIFNLIKIVLRGKASRYNFLIYLKNLFNS